MLEEVDSLLLPPFVDRLVDGALDLLGAEVRLDSRDGLVELAELLQAAFGAGALGVAVVGDQFQAGRITGLQVEAEPVQAQARAEGTPAEFLDFLIAEALVQIGADVPEHCLPFFGERYRDLAAVGDLGPSETYQLAVALYEAWVGLQTREVFRDWAGEQDRLHAAWADAGSRLTDRLSDLAGAVARGEMTFVAATEFACSAVKHDLDLPAPFSALDTQAYRDHGPDYAVRWAEKTFEKLD